MTQTEVNAMLVRLYKAYEHNRYFEHGDTFGFELEAALRHELQLIIDDYTIYQRAEIKNAFGDHIGNHDLVIADASAAPLRVSTTGRGVALTPQSVRATLEVTATLTPAKLRLDLDKVLTTRSYPRPPDEPDTEWNTVHGQQMPYFRISSGIVAFHSRMTLPMIALALEERAKLVGYANVPQFVTVLNRGHVFWCRAATGMPWSWPAVGDRAMYRSLWRHRHSNYFSVNHPAGALVALLDQLEQVAAIFDLQRRGHQPRPPRRTYIGLVAGMPVFPDGVPNPYLPADA